MMWSLKYGSISDTSFLRVCFNKLCKALELGAESDFDINIQMS